MPLSWVRQIRHWDVNSFILRRLAPPRSGVVLVSAFLFAAGVVLWLSDVHAQAWAAAFVGLMSILIEVRGVIAGWVKSPEASLTADENAAEVLKDLDLPVDHHKAGYSVVHAPPPLNEAIVRSRLVEVFLRAKDYTLVEGLQLLRPVEDRLRGSAEVLKSVLRCQYRKSWRNDELRSSIAILLADRQLSVPLWVSLMCLKESLDGDPERWKTFLAM
jgi:hypothetical protein